MSGCLRKRSQNWSALSVVALLGVLIGYGLAAQGLSGVEFVASLGFAAALLMIGGCGTRLLGEQRRCR
jgi:hypothetical protein